MATLKALETLALEGGRVSPGQVFELKSAEDAAILIAQGRAEASNETPEASAEVAPRDFVTGPKAEAKETTKKLGHK